VSKGKRVRPSYPKTIICLLLAQRPHGEHWAHDITERARIKQGTVWGILRRMQDDDGWLTSRVEPKRPGHPGNPRRLYRVTAEGLAALRDVYEFAQGKDLYEQWMPTNAPTVPDGVIPQQSHPQSHPRIFDADYIPPPSLPGPEPLRERGKCRECGEEYTLRLDETVPGHPRGNPRNRCPGSWLYPAKDHATTHRSAAHFPGRADRATVQRPNGRAAEVHP
jgi:DNA-binding PadR family transcriptional regulator